METVTVAAYAMNTRFEILLHGDNPITLRAAGEQALDEIVRLEAQLSLYKPESEISAVNRHAASRPVRVTPPVFRLLQTAQKLSAATGGTFDITVAPLVRAWGFMGNTGSLPTREAVQEALSQVGMHRVELDEKAYTVRFREPGMMMDLGAIGKGYAIDMAAEFLLEAGVTSAFIHGGTSSSLAIGNPPDASAWKAAIPKPQWKEGAPTAGDSATATGTDGLLATVTLCNESLGVSAVWGRAFREGDRYFGHIIDPRTGEPVQRALLAAVVAPSATETDALSTALITLGEEGLELLGQVQPAARGLVVVPDRSASDGFRTAARGF